VSLAITPHSERVLEAIELASRDELEALQLERLQRTLFHGYANVPHYRRAFDSAGVHPSDLRQLADLARYPFLRKSDFREQYPFGLFAVPRTQVARIHGSSGTTGKATLVGYTQNDISTWAQLVARSIYAAGGRPGKIVHIAYGYGLFTGGIGAHYGAERLGCTVVPCSGGQTQRQVELICDLQPDIIMVTPSYMLTILEEFQRQGLEAVTCSLSIGIFGAEPWSEGMRATIESRAGLNALDIYGLSEIMGPGVASECIESKDGPVIWEDHFYPEIIDPVTGDVLADGEQGELVLTSLSKEALPVIRYRTRDRTRLLPPTSRAMRRMARVCGRTDDMLIIRGVNVFPSQIEEIILKQALFAPVYLLEIDREKNLDRMTVHVELAESCVQHVDGDRLAAWLGNAIKDVVGITVTVRVLPSRSLERSMGKASRVVDRRSFGESTEAR
jgi:phenylacetate-CoA ligase